MDEHPTPSQSEAPSASAGGEAARSAWLDRHLWEIQPLRDVAVIAAVLGLVYLGRLASLVTVPLLLAGLLAYLLEPVVQRLTRLHPWVTRGRAVAAIMLTGLVAAVIPGVLGAVYGAVQVAWLAQDAALGIGRVAAALADESKAADLGEGTWRSVYAWLQRLASSPGLVEGDQLVAWLRENGRTLAGGVVSTGATAISTALGAAGWVVSLVFTGFLTGFFFFFVSTGWPGVVKFGRSLLPDAHAERAAGLLGQMDRAISGFVRGRLTIALIQSLVFSVGYAALGVPASILLGIGVAFLSIVPYLAVVGIPVSIVLLWLEGHTGIRGQVWFVLGAPVVLYYLVQTLDDYVLTPWIQGRELDMDIPTVLFATFAGAALLGVYGLLLAIPLAACVKILLREVVWPRFRRWAEGVEPDPLPMEGRRS